MEPATAGAEVAQDVAEQVGADHHVEPVGVLDEVGAQDVDVELGRRHVRVVPGDRGEAFVPVGHGDGDAVGLGGAGEVLAGPGAGELEGVADDAVGAGAGEDALLGGELTVGALEHAAADGGVLAFRVLADDEEVDLGRGAAGEGGGNAGHELAGADVDVLVEGAADGDEQAPQGHVVGDGGPADGAEEDGVVPAELVEAVRRHHAAGLRVGFAGPVVGGDVQGEAEPARGGAEHAQAFGNDFLADAVAGQRRDAVRGHGSSCLPAG